jgi:hypothetical protein
MNHAYWTKELREAEAELEAATMLTAVKAAGKKLQRASRGPKIVDEKIRAEQLTQTREAAAALVEDLAHIREILGGNPSRDEWRRLSGTLRRILVDGDLTRLAAPRIGRILLRSPDNKPFIKVITQLDPPPIFFASGGAKAFGMLFRVMTLNMGVVNEKDRAKLFAFDAEKIVQLRLENFLSQQVLLFRGAWATRRDVIKYMANIASGVHSDAPSERADILLRNIQRAITYSRSTGVYFNTKAIRGEDIAFRYDPDELDVVLLELMAAAAFLVSSDDTARLEVAIQDELDAFRRRKPPTGQHSPGR